MNDAGVRLGFTPDPGSEATDEDVLRWTLQYACLAPSIHNSQPWLFELRDDTVKLYADPARIMPVIDPDGRQLVISCGAALANLLIAARAAGHRPVVDVASPTPFTDHLATVRLAGHRPAGKVDRVLFDAIPRRHTNRYPLDGTTVPPALLAVLRRHTADHEVDLTLVDGANTRAALATLVRHAEGVQADSIAFREELRRWSRPAGSDAADGIPFHARGLGAAGQMLTSVPTRNFDIDASVTSGHPRTGPLVVDHPVLALLWTASDQARDWLRTGMAVEHVLLHACAAGVSGSFLNQPIDDPTLRSWIRGELQIAGFPQLLLRLGYGPPTLPTPRRAVADIMR